MYFPRTNDKCIQVDELQILNLNNTLKDNRNNKKLKYLLGNKCNKISSNNFKYSNLIYRNLLMSNQFELMSNLRIQFYLFIY